MIEAKLLATCKLMPQRLI